MVSQRNTLAIRTQYRSRWDTLYSYNHCYLSTTQPQPISPGEDILAYLNEAAEEQNIMGKIRFNVNVESARFVVV